MAGNDPSSKRVKAGWPVENYAVNLRRWNTGNSGSGGTRVAIATPRHKHLFFVEFVLASDVTQTITNVGTFLKDQSIYAQLKAVDLPKPKFATDNLRSYNRNYKIQKKLEFEALTLKFYDDSTSMVMALIKDLMNFVNYSAEIGNDRRKTIGQGSSHTTEFNKFSYNQTGVAALAGNSGDMIRAQMDTRPSLGMKMGNGRLFFEAINVYDLGTEPDSINIYTYMNPHLVSVDPENRDQSESGVAELSMVFEYENYSFAVGQPKNAVQAFIDEQLAVPGSPSYKSAAGHALMKTESIKTDELFRASEERAGNTVARDVLGVFVADTTNNTVIGPGGRPGITNEPGGNNYGNHAKSALEYYRNQLQRARESYSQVAVQGVLSPEVLQYRRQQILIMERQVDALQQYERGISGGNMLPFGIETNNATVNSVNILLAGGADLLGVSKADSQLFQNVIAQNLINSKRLALEARAKQEDIAAQQSLAQQSLANTQSENLKLAADSEFHKQQASILRKQAASLLAPTQFPTYAPGNYGNQKTPTGGVISAVTRGVAIQAISSYLGIKGGY